MKSSSPTTDTHLEHKRTVSLVNVSYGPSLALRNLRAYVGSEPRLRDQYRVTLHEFPISWTWGYPGYINEALDRMVRRVLEDRPEVVGLSVSLWNVREVEHLSRMLKRFDPNVFIVVGGPEVFGAPEEFLATHPFVDVVVLNDGEIAFSGLLDQRQRAKSDLHQVPGLVFRDGAALVRSTCTTVPELDWSRLFNVYRLPEEKLEIRGWPYRQVLSETQRGCVYHCAYCLYGREVRKLKPVDQSVEDLYLLLSQGHVVRIVDSTFAADLNRAKQILSGLAARRYPGMITFDTVPERFDRELVDLCNRANVVLVDLGVQTFSSAAKAAISRRNDQAAIEGTAKLIMDGLRANACWHLMYPLPGATAQDHFYAFDWLSRLGASLFAFRLRVLPGAELSRAEELAPYQVVHNEEAAHEVYSTSTLSHLEFLAISEMQHTYHELVAFLSPRQIARVARSVDSLASALCGVVGDLAEVTKERGELPYRRWLRLILKAIGFFRLREVEGQRWRNAFGLMASVLSTLYTRLWLLPRLRRGEERSRRETLEDLGRIVLTLAPRRSTSKDKHYYERWGTRL